MTATDELRREAACEDAMRAGKLGCGSCRPCLRTTLKRYQEAMEQCVAASVTATSKGDLAMRIEKIASSLLLPISPTRVVVLPGSSTDVRGNEPECHECLAEGKQCIAGNGQPGHHGVYENSTTGACAFCGHGRICASWCGMFAGDARKISGSSEGGPNGPRFWSMGSTWYDSPECLNSGRPLRQRFPIREGEGHKTTCDSWNSGAPCDCGWAEILVARRRGTTT